MEKQLKCTYCGGTEFYEGPEGPGFTNILCANPQCRHWFNKPHGGFGLQFGLMDLNKVEPTEEERAQLVYQEVEERRAGYMKFYHEGAEMYRQGQPAINTLEENIQGRWNIIRHADIFRLAGYIDAYVRDPMARVG